MNQSHLLIVTQYLIMSSKPTMDFYKNQIEAIDDSKGYIMLIILHLEYITQHGIISNHII